MMPFLSKLGTYIMPDWKTVFNVHSFGPVICIILWHGLPGGPPWHGRTGGI